MSGVTRSDLVLVTVSSADFVPGTLVLIDSFREHNPWFLGEAVVLVGPELDSAARFSLERLPKTSIRFVDERLRKAARVLGESVPSLKGRERRFYSLQAFRDDEPRWVLFMDSDMLCLGDVSNAFSDGVPLAACRDGCVFRGFRRDPLSFAAVAPETAGSLSRPFNSGFMVASPSVRGGEVFEALIAELHPNRWTTVRSGNTDQVALNRVFADRCRWLSSTFNFREAAGEQIELLEGVRLEDAAVIHFTGPDKPWHLRGALRQAARSQRRERMLQQWLAAYARAQRRHDLPRLSVDPIGSPSPAP
jgi:hypothetical protein